MKPHLSEQVNSGSANPICLDLDVTEQRCQRLFPNHQVDRLLHRSKVFS